MRWTLKHRNILDEAADALICSANVNLTLSGGVGAELLGRFGNRMQESLLRTLQTRAPRCAQRGEVFAYVGDEVPYRVIVHAVAIDGWYASTPQVISDVISRALQLCADHDAR